MQALVLHIHGAYPPCSSKHSGPAFIFFNEYVHCVVLIVIIWVSKQLPSQTDFIGRHENDYTNYFDWYWLFIHAICFYIYDSIMNILSYSGHFMWNEIKLNVSIWPSSTIGGTESCDIPSHRINCAAPWLYVVNTDLDEAWLLQSCLYHKQNHFDKLRPWMWPDHKDEAPRI